MQDTARPVEGDPWKLDASTMTIVALLGLVFVLLFGVASAVALSTLAPPPQLVSASDIDRFVGDDPDFDIRPIPGCPDGFRIGEDIYVVPDPEACGFRRLGPGERGNHPVSGIIVVPNTNGAVGQLEIDDSGRLGLGDLGTEGTSRGDSLFDLRRRSDGTFNLRAPDGSSAEIAADDRGSWRVTDSNVPQSNEVAGGQSEALNGGGSGTEPRGALPPLTDRERGDLPPLSDEIRDPDTSVEPDERAVPEDDTQLDTDGRAPTAPSEPRDATRPNNRPNDAAGSGLALAGLLLVLGAVGAFALAAALLRRRSPAQADSSTPGSAVVSSETERQEFTYEINALDLLLHELSLETDPRLAIQKVYAALELGLGDSAMVRRRSETPHMFVDRLLGHGDELTPTLNELVGLFERARFSEHEITIDMRNRAMHLLHVVRDHYVQRTEEFAAALEAVPA